MTPQASKPSPQVYARIAREPRKEPHMKAILYTRYGSPDVLQFKEVGQPQLEDNRVLVKVHAASVNPLDWHAMTGAPFLVRIEGGWRKPKDPRLGTDFAGRIEAVGSKVTQFQVGDEVFGTAPGTFAEYACAREDRIVLKPANLSFEAAAAVPVAAITALQGLRDKGQIKAGQQVLIYGAAGGVGTFAVQLAKAFGAEVTAVCSTRNVDQTRTLGADHIIDYTQTDFIRSKQRYDLILAVNGYHPLLAYRRVLRPNGRLVGVGASSHLMRSVFQGIFLGPIMRAGRKKAVSFLAEITPQDLAFLKDLLDAGKVVPVIDRQYPLSETAEAVGYVEAGHARGKVVITVDE